MTIVHVHEAEEVIDDGDVVVSKKFVEFMRLKAQELNRELVNAKVPISDWQLSFMGLIQTIATFQLLTALGGSINKAQEQQKRDLSTFLRRQFGFVRNLANDILKRQNEGMSPAKLEEYINNRTDMYAEKTVEVFWKASAPFHLPQVPRDGKTKCRMFCKCSLRIVAIEDTDFVDYEVYWRLGHAEHCDDCVRLAREWNPYRVRVRKNQ